MAEKLKVDAEIQPEAVPLIAQVIMSMLAELNIKQYEPHVVNKLLDFAKRYVTNVLNDAKRYSNQAGKRTIDVAEVRLAADLTPNVYLDLDLDLDADVDTDEDNIPSTSKGVKRKRPKMDDI